MLTVERVRTSTDLDEFITLPRRLYDGRPGFVSPLDIDRRQMLDPAKSAFFTHGIASYWIARQNGTAVGRISAQIDFAADQADAAKIGLFGCLDAVDDREVVASLLSTAEAWLRQRNRHILRGPFLLSINGEPGLMTEGQTEAPVTLLGWHPEYLANHLPDSGYQVATRLLCFVLGDQGDFQFDRRLAELGRARDRASLTVRPLRLDALQSDMEQARQIFNDGWRRNWNFTPATETDVAELISQFKPFIFRDSGFFIDVAGEPAAFVLSIPNIFEITKDLGPRPSIAGWLRLLYRIWLQRYHGFRLVLIGVASKYQSSVVGKLISTVAFEEVRLRMRARQVKELIAGWIVEENQEAIRPLLSLGFRKTRTYNLYEKTFTMR
jgi:hypothetical protein